MSTHSVLPDRPTSLTFGSLALVAWMLMAAKPYPDGPPSGYSGGFGEPTCVECHVGAAENPPDGFLELTGLRDGAVDREGRSVDSVRVLQLSLAKPGMKRAGFQITARFPDGRQAGRFEPLDTRVSVDQDGVSYLIQTEEGSVVHSDSTAWRFRWILPSDTGNVVLHGAANASNGDDTPIGDAILTRSWSVRIER